LSGKEGTEDECASRMTRLGRKVGNWKKVEMKDGKGEGFN
jgi:hypothetical protein